MALNAKSFQLIEADTAQSQRLRFLLATLYGEQIDVDMCGFFMNATEEEITCWLNIQKVFYTTKGDNLRLKGLADNAKLEYQAQKAFEEGRAFAYEMLPNVVAVDGVKLRETKNPYRNNKACPEVVKKAWTEGFQNAFEVISAESW